MTKEYLDKECRVCGCKTEQIFNIDLKMAYICKKCESRIVMQSVSDIYRKLLEDK